MWIKEGGRGILLNDDWEERQVEGREDGWLARGYFCRHSTWDRPCLQSMAQEHV